MYVLAYMVSLYAGIWTNNYFIFNPKREDLIRHMFLYLTDIFYNEKNEIFGTLYRALNKIIHSLLKASVEALSNELLNYLLARAVKIKRGYYLKL